MEHTILILRQKVNIDYGAEEPSSFLQKCLRQKQSSTHESNPRKSKAIAFIA